jgi:hypothetical protein
MMALEWLDGAYLVESGIRNALPNFANLFFDVQVHIAAQKVEFTSEKAEPAPCGHAEALNPSMETKRAAQVAERAAYSRTIPKSYKIIADLRQLGGHSHPPQARYGQHPALACRGQR